MYAYSPDVSGAVPLPKYINPPAPFVKPPPYFPKTAAPSPLPPTPSFSGNPYDSDPGYQAAIQNQKIQGAANAQSLQSLISQRLIAYGDPNLAGQYGADAAAIAANTQAGNSELSRLQKSHTDARQSIINHLAARGIIFSGETGYQEGQEDQNYGHNVYDAQQKLLGDIFGYRQQELSQQQSLQDQVASALQNAWQNYISNPALYGMGQDQATASAPLTQDESSANAMVNLLKSKGYFS